MEEEGTWKLEDGKILWARLEDGELHPLTFHWPGLSQMTTPPAREAGKCGPAGLPLAKKEGRTDLGRQLPVLAQKMESIFLRMC